MEKNHLNVVAAVVMKDGKYLCMQRCRSQYPYTSEHWEFPGGITEEGECEHEALIREIKEEMDWDIYVGRKLGTVDYEYQRPAFAALDSCRRKAHPRASHWLNITPSNKTTTPQCP